MARDETAKGTTPTLEELLRHDDDLRLWLEHTRYFDVEHRRRVLDAARSFRAFDEERKKFLAKVQLTAGVPLSADATCGQDLPHLHLQEQTVTRTPLEATAVDKPRIDVEGLTITRRDQGNGPRTAC